MTDSYWALIDVAYGGSPSVTWVLCPSGHLSLIPSRGGKEGGRGQTISTRPGCPDFLFLNNNQCNFLSPQLNSNWYDGAGDERKKTTESVVSRNQMCTDQSAAAGTSSKIKFYSKYQNLMLNTNFLFSIELFGLIENQ